MVLGIEVHMNELYDVVLIFVQSLNVVVQFQKMGSNFILQIVYFSQLSDHFSDLRKLRFCFEQFISISRPAPFP